MYENPKVFELYKELFAKYGSAKAYWPQWCETNKKEYTMQIVTLGAILVQRTTWGNAEKAILNLKKHDLLSLDKLAKLSELELTQHIKVAGFYNTKLKKVKEFAAFVLERYGDMSTMRKVENIKILRDELLNVYGIGPETADTIILFGLDKPAFVVDEYTKRFVKKYSLFEFTDNTTVRENFTNNLPISTEIYQNYHVFKILDQKPLEKCVMTVI